MLEITDVEDLFCSSGIVRLKGSKEKALKLDFNKAYDLVCLNYVCEVMIKMGFDMK